MHSGRRADLGGIFMRSTWESNYARFLNWVKEPWEYEPTTFEFKTIKKGARFYTPDFWLPKKGYYVEIKGYMDPVSKTKLSRMARYYPDVKIVVIGKREYVAIAKKVERLIPNWE